MEKEFCRYAIYDAATGVRLVGGEKYKLNREFIHFQGAKYVESFKGFCTRFRKVSAFFRNAVIKGRAVEIVYWYGTFRRAPSRYVTEAGQVLGLR